VAERRKGSDTNTSTHGARVLIADDDESMREVLSQLLEEEGYTLDEAASGQEVLEKVATTNKSRPDIVLLDIGMPDTDGIQVLQTILEQGIDIPVIIITGRGAGSLVVKAMQIGAADYIRKPFADLDDIVQRIQLNRACQIRLHLRDLPVWRRRPIGV